MLYKHWLIIVILLAAMILTVKGRKLTVAASLVAAIVGAMVYIGARYVGIGMLAAFFTLGTVATSWKLAAKQRLGLAEENKGRRTTGQVLANAGVAAILALLTQLDPSNSTLYQLMMAGSLASATADTLSSEMGNIYGRHFYNIVTLKRDARGLDGVVSLEGTSIGVLGCFVIALIYAVGFSWSSDVIWIVAAGTVGNLSDSVLGATVERKHLINNNAVNFLNTAVGALAALAFSFV